MVQHLSKEQRREQLLQSATVAFGSRGYHQTQVSDIIKQAGVARGTFYLYFKGKREIFDCIMTDLLEQVSSKVRSLPRDAADQIPTQLKGNIARVTDLLLDQPMLAKILFNESVGLDSELDRRLRQFYSQLLALICKGLNQGQEMGFVRQGNVKVLAIALLGAVKEIFYQYFLGTEQPDRDTIVSELFSLVIHAVTHPDLQEGLPALVAEA
jgi:AcrR family transcriptional regulator